MVVIGLAVVVTVLTLVVTGLTVVVVDGGMVLCLVVLVLNTAALVTLDTVVVLTGTGLLVVSLVVGKTVDGCPNSVDFCVTMFVVGIFAIKVVEIFGCSVVLSSFVTIFSVLISAIFSTVFESNGVVLFTVVLSALVVL